jgi:hypothetical protein
MLNVALRVETSSRAHQALKWWGRELRRPYGPVSSYCLEFFADCPDPPHCGQCSFTIHGRQISIPAMNRRDTDTPIHSEIFNLRRVWPALPPSIVELIDEFKDVTFLRLREPIKWDTEFIRNSRVGDCAGVATLLVKEAKARRLPARFSYGMALTPPFCTGHYWAEFLVDGVWVPVDPVLISALISLHFLPEPAWSPRSSLGGILARLSGDTSVGPRHGSVAVDVSFRVTRNVRRGAAC